MTDDATKSLAAKYKISVPSQLEHKDTILVVEDQTELRLIVVHQLQKLNFSGVRQAANGYEALELVRSEKLKVAAVICDMEMPVMGGLDFLTELREAADLDRGPFLLTMDGVSKEKIMLAVESGCDGVMVKPYTLGDIGPKVRDAFAKFHTPNNPEKLYELAKLAYREGKLDGAEAIYRELAAAAPKAARPVVGLARIEMKRQQWAKAQKLLDDAEARNKHYVHLFVERAHIFAAQSAWEKAIEQFKNAIKLSPLNAVRYRSAADLLFKVKRYSEAVELLEMALSYNLLFPDLYHYLSQAKFALKDFKGASKYIRSALNADEDNVTYLNQLGICLKETGQLEDAAKIYNQVIKIDPTNGPALYNKAVLIRTKGDVTEAIKILERLLRKHPDFPAAAAKLAEYQKEENAKQAS